MSADNVDVTPRNLAAKWQPGALAHIPEEDHYGHQSIQDPVLASLPSAIAAFIGYWAVVLVYTLTDGGMLWQTLGFVTLAVLVISLPAIQSWATWYARPVYISSSNGQMLIGQTAVGWALTGGSSPDTVNFQTYEVKTPDQPWYIRMIFRTNEQVVVPAHDKKKAYIIKLPKRAMDKLYVVQDKYQTVRSKSFTATVETADLLREIRDQGGLAAQEQMVRRVVREELSRALESLPRDVAIEVAKCFKVRSATSESTDSDTPNNEPKEE